METKLNKKSVKDVDVTGKRVLLRVDFNVPLNENGSVMDDEKIAGALPTIQHLIKKGAKVIVVSHLGRPEGRAVENLRMTAVAERLSHHLGKPVKKMNDCIGDDVKKAVANMKDGDVILLENLRFHKEEEANNEAFAKSLASLADIFVNDAFGSVHRAHASTVGVTKFLPSVAGLLVEKEIKIMGKALHNPDRPFVVIMGGSKVADKIDVLKNLSDKADSLLIGGGMAFTFLKAQGYEIGKSIVEKDKVGVARDILKEYEAKGKKIILPADVVVSSDVEKADSNTKIKTVAIDKIPPDLIGVDIGPKTVTLFVKEIKKAKTIIWNGPVGVFEVKEFAQGSLAIAKALAASGALTIVGGGDTVAAVEQSGVAKKITHLSTGGGASLEFLEGKALPGIVALNDRDG